MQSFCCDAMPFSKLNDCHKWISIHLSMQEKQQWRQQKEEESLKNAVLDTETAARFSTAAAAEARSRKGVASTIDWRTSSLAALPEEDTPAAAAKPAPTVEDPDRVSKIGKVGDAGVAVTKSGSLPLRLQGSAGILGSFPLSIFDMHFTLMHSSFISCSFQVATDLLSYASRSAFFVPKSDAAEYNSSWQTSKDLDDHSCVLRAASDTLWDVTSDLIVACLCLHRGERPEACKPAQHSC